MHNQPRWKIACALGAVYLIWSSTYLAIRVGVETLPPFLMAGVRYLVAGAVLYGWLWLRGTAKPARIHWRSATIVGAAMLLGGNGAVCWAEQRVPSGLTALIIGTTPLWFAVFDWRLHGAGRPTGRTVIGLICGFVGVGLLVSPGEFAGGRHVDLVGAAVLMGAAMSWAAGSLYSRTAALPESPWMATAMEMLAGGVVLLIASGLTGEWSRAGHLDVSLRSALALVYLIGPGSLIAFSAFTWLLRATSTAVVSTYAYVNPVLAVVLGWWLLGEPVTPRVVLAATAIIVAVMVLVSRPAKPATTS